MKLHRQIAKSPRGFSRAENHCNIIARWRSGASRRHIRYGSIIYYFFISFNNKSWRLGDNLRKALNLLHFLSPNHFLNLAISGDPWRLFCV